MNNEWDMLESWSSRIAAITAIAGAAYAAFRYIKNAVVKVLNVANRVQQISDQLVSNGGSSLRDAIHRIESRQVQTEQRERAFLQHHDTPMFEVDSKLSMRWANVRFLRMVNFDSDDAAGYGWHNAIHEDDRERVVALFDTARETVRNIQTTCRFVVQKDHPQMHVLSATVMRDVDNNAGGFFINLTLPSAIINPNQNIP